VPWCRGIVSDDCLNKPVREEASRRFAIVDRSCGQPRGRRDARPVALAGVSFCGESLEKSLGPATPRIYSSPTFAGGLRPSLDPFTFGGWGANSRVRFARKHGSRLEETDLLSAVFSLQGGTIEDIGQSDAAPEHRVGIAADGLAASNWSVNVPRAPRRGIGGQEGRAEDFTRHAVCLRSVRGPHLACLPAFGGRTRSYRPRKHRCHTSGLLRLPPFAQLPYWSGRGGWVWPALLRPATLRPRSLGFLGGCVLSHWVRDAVSHRPNMPLRPGGQTYVGLGLWNSIPATVAVEFGLFVTGVVLYVRSTAARDRIGRYAFWALVATLAVLYGASLLGPPPPSARPRPGTARGLALHSLGMVG
jgi:hypothetical protein